MNKMFRSCTKRCLLVLTNHFHQVFRVMKLQYLVSSHSFCVMLRSVS